MGKNKLKKFAAVKEWDHFFEPTMDDIKQSSFELKGKWNQEFFKNDNPIVLELGCGKGEYSVGLGKRMPNKNFIGIDIKGARMYIGAQEAAQNEMENIAFLRTKIDFIESFFGENEVDEIWLTFSDPQPKKPRKRLTSELFINRYRSFLKPGGKINLKTDNTELYEWTLEEVEAHGYQLETSNGNIYESGYLNKIPEEQADILSIRTHYEQLFSDKGEKIKYCRFTVS